MIFFMRDFVCVLCRIPQGAETFNQNERKMLASCTVVKEVRTLFFQKPSHANRARSVCVCTAISVVHVLVHTA